MSLIIETSEIIIIINQRKVSDYPNTVKSVHPGHFQNVDKNVAVVDIAYRVE